jgi:transcriptional regulator with XRE-family HTH domain
MLRARVDFMTTKLPTQNPVPEPTIESQLCSFGARLRELRLRRGMTLEDLAAHSALSKGFLSRLESGGRQPSIAAVLTLSRILDVSVAFFFESPLAMEPCVIVRAAEAQEGTANGLKYAVLSNAGRFSRLQPLRIRVSPSRRGSEHYHHAGEEWIYVLSGRLILSLAGRTYELGSGDAAHFESRLPHRLIAPGPEAAELLLVASPDVNPGQHPVFLEHRAIPGMTLMPPSGLQRTAASDKTEGTPIPSSKKPRTKNNPL